MLKKMIGLVRSERKISKGVVAVKEAVGSVNRRSREAIHERPALVKVRANLVMDVTFFLTSLSALCLALQDQYPWMGSVVAILAHAPLIAPVLVGGSVLYLRYANVISTNKVGVWDYSEPDMAGPGETAPGDPPA